jgi:transketolase
MIDPKILARDSRLTAVQLVASSQSSHIASSLSVIDILAVLYSRKINKLKFDDIIILSKGHAAAGFYSILATLDLIDKKELNSYCTNGSKFGGHVTHTATNEVVLSTGSLGHGLPFATGKAFGFKLNNKKCDVYVIISDGECDEGTTWESALFAAHHDLSNLYLFIDRNHLQSLKSTEDTLKLEPLAQKWRAFGWEVREINGNSLDEIELTLKDLTHIIDRPKVIIANTIKGKGVSFMENDISWHYKSPNEEQLAVALSEIENS